MIPFVQLVAVLLLASYKGSSAVTPVFVQRGNDVLLDVIEDVPEKFFFLVWTFSGKDVLVTLSRGNEPTITPNYTGRVEFSKVNYSVKLKNLQETDSGVYTARVTAAQDQTVAKYNVTVQDPVSPVTLTVDPVSNSSDSCNLTVTCRTQDSSQDISSTFTCPNQVCIDRETSKTTTSGAVLRVYYGNHSIICNHSNYVNWTKGQILIQDFCPLHNAVPSGAMIAVIAGGPVLIVLLVAFFWFICKKNKEKKQTQENTVYAVPEDVSRAQTQNQEQSLNPVTSTYAMVNFPMAPGSTNIPNISSLPETIYAQVNKTAKPTSSRAPQPTPRSKKHHEDVFTEQNDNMYTNAE